jgi:hypothetical protein
MGTGRIKPLIAHSRSLPTIALLAAMVGIGGCVDRRFIIESNVPNAQVFIDDRPVGAAPAHAAFEYYGKYKVTLIQPGYEPLTELVHVTAPWYAYPPLDFLTEVVWPFHIRDTRRYYFELHEATKTRVEDLVNNAEALREQSRHLPVPDRPAKPRVQPVPIGPPVGVPPGIPGEPGGPAIPVIPPVGPGPTVPSGPGGTVPPPGPQSGPVIPNVGP